MVGIHFQPLHTKDSHTYRARTHPKPPSPHSDGTFLHLSNHVLREELLRIPMSQTLSLDLGLQQRASSAQAVPPKARSPGGRLSETSAHSLCNDKQCSRRERAKKHIRGRGPTLAVRAYRLTFWQKWASRGTDGVAALPQGRRDSAREGRCSL